MFWGECGTKNAKNAKFCEKCGAKLEVEEAPVEKKTASKANAEKKESTNFLYSKIANKSIGDDEK